MSKLLGYILVFKLCLINVYAAEFKQTAQVLQMKEKIKSGEIVLGMPAEIEEAHCIMRKAAAAIGEQIGKNIILKPLPSKRLPSFVKRGLVHGDFSRTPVYSTLVPEAYKVPTPLVLLPFYAFGYDLGNKSITNWQSLKKYKLVQARGHSFVNKHLKQHDVHFVGSSRAALGFIKMGRADIFVTDQVTAEFIIAKYKPEFVGIQKLGDVLAYMSMNTYIAPQYPELVAEYNAGVKKYRQLEDYHHIVSEAGCE